jgi:hypothetical protein
MAARKTIERKIPDDLVMAQTRFQAWRGQRLGKTRIPADLWELAVQLTLHHRTGLVASVLGLNPTALKSKSVMPGKKNTPANMPLVKFAPVHFQAPVPMISKSDKKTCRPSIIAEVVSSSGISIRMFSGIDVVSLKLLSELIQEVL